MLLIVTDAIYRYITIILCIVGVIVLASSYWVARSKVNIDIGKLLFYLSLTAFLALLTLCLSVVSPYSISIVITGGLSVLLLLLFTLRLARSMQVQYHKFKTIEELDAEINERINLEEKIIAKNKQLEWAEDAASICYGYWDTVNDKIIFSDGAQKILNIKPGITLPFDAILEMTVPEYVESVKQIRSRIIVSKSIEPFTFAIAISGKEKYIRVNGEIYLNNGIRYFRGTFQDVTEQQLFIRKIEEKNAALREIASIQSHNVRGPLATIMGLVNLINPDDSFTQENKEIMDGLKQASIQLDEVIKTIVEKSNALDK